MITSCEISIYIRSKPRDHKIKDDHTHGMMLFLIIDYGNYNLKKPNHVIASFDIFLFFYKKKDKENDIYF